MTAPLARLAAVAIDTLTLIGALAALVVAGLILFVMTPLGAVSMALVLAAWIAS
jgi:hypothetical protein